MNSTSGDEGDSNPGEFDYDTGEEKKTLPLLDDPAVEVGGGEDRCVRRLALNPRECSSLEPDLSVPRGYVHALEVDVGIGAATNAPSSIDFAAREQVQYLLAVCSESDEQRTVSWRGSVGVEEIRKWHFRSWECGNAYAILAQI